MDTKKLFEAIDSMDVDMFLSFLTDDATFVFGNNPAAKGKEQIKEAVSGFFSTIDGLKHSSLETLSENDRIVIFGNVTYIKKDNSEVTFPFCNVLKIKGDLIQDYHIYIDASPLFS